MKVIMLENIEKVGLKGEVVNVKRGFARNYLIPRKFAIYATPKNIGNLSQIKEVLAAEEQKRLNELKLLAEKLAGISLSFVRKVDENEHMFGSVSENDIVQELKKMDVEIHKSTIHMDKHIKELGAHAVQIRLHKDIVVELKLTVDKEQD